MEERGVEETKDDEVSSPFIFYCCSVNFQCTFSFMQSWMWSSFLVILKFLFLFYYPRSNFFIHMQVDQWRRRWRTKKSEGKTRREYRKLESRRKLQNMGNPLSFSSSSSSSSSSMEDTGGAEVFFDRSFLNFWIFEFLNFAKIAQF